MTEEKDELPRKPVAKSRFADCPTEHPKIKYTFSPKFRIYSLIFQWLPFAEAFKLLCQLSTVTHSLTYHAESQGMLGYHNRQHAFFEATRKLCPHCNEAENLFSDALISAACEECFNKFELVKVSTIL